MLDELLEACRARGIVILTEYAHNSAHDAGAEFLRGLSVQISHYSRRRFILHCWTDEDTLTELGRYATADEVARAAYRLLSA